MKRILFASLIFSSMFANAAISTAHVAITAGAHHSNSNHEETLQPEEMFQIIQSSHNVKGVMICSAYRKNFSKGHSYEGCDIGTWSSSQQSIVEFFHKNRHNEDDEIIAIYLRDSEFLIYYR